SLLLLKPHAPLVGKGIEDKAAADSGAAVVAQFDGVVEYVDAREIRVRREDGALDKYPLIKYHRSNASASYNQTPNVTIVESVTAGEILAYGPSIEKGEIALGQLTLISCMT